MAKKKREIQEVNAGSMADIAFLLLVFFLVTTTMNQNQGIGAMLPPWVEDEDIEQIDLKMRNVLEILVNKDDRILLEGDEIAVTDLREKVREFFTSIGQPGFPETMKKAVVSLKNDRGTSYKMYIGVQNELHAAINELRDELAMAKYKTNYATLKELAYDPMNPNRVKDKKKMKEIKDAFPKRISEAEPQK